MNKRAENLVMNMKTSNWIKGLAAVTLLLLSGVAAAAVPGGATITNTVNISYFDESGQTEYTDSDTVDVTVRVIYDLVVTSETVDQEIQTTTTTTAYTARVQNNGNANYNRVSIVNDSAAEQGTGGFLDSNSYDYSATDGDFTAISTTLGDANSFTLFGAITDGTKTGTCNTGNCTFDLYDSGVVDVTTLATTTSTLLIDGIDCTYISYSTGSPTGTLTVNCTGNGEPAPADGALVGEYITFSYTYTATFDANDPTTIPNDVQAHDFSFAAYTNDCTTPCATPSEQEDLVAQAPLDTTTVVGPVLRLFKYVRNTDTVTTPALNPTCSAGSIECVAYDGATYFDQGVEVEPGDTLEYLIVILNTADATYYNAVDATYQQNLTTNCGLANNLSTCNGSATGTMGYADDVVADDTVAVFSTASAPLIDLTCNGTAVDATETFGNDASGVVRTASGAGASGETMYFYVGTGANDDVATGASASGGQLAANTFACVTYTVTIDS